MTRKGTTGASLVDLTGMRFTRWTVIRLDPAMTRHRHWHCVCDCGTRRLVNGYSLRSGASRSCGCFASDWTVEKHTTHGMHKHPAYQSWRACRSRCEVPGTEGYSEYGGRGITVCDRWNSFEAFWEDMGATWQPGLSVDRIDTNGHYEPGNCRWATPKEQANNRRNHRVINTPGGPMNVTEAAARFGISRITIFSRIGYGWPEHRLLEPVQHTTRDYRKKPKQE